MTTVQVVETSVTVNNNSTIQDYVHPDDQTQPFGTYIVEMEIAPYSVHTVVQTFLLFCNLSLINCTKKCFLRAYKLYM